MAIRWKRWAAGAAAFVALYAAAGFWGVPWLAKRELASFAETRLQRRASVGELAFNPFTLRLRASDIQFAEADGAPIAAIGVLSVEMLWRSISTGAWRFGEIDISQPSANLAISPDGRFNIVELVEALRKGQAPSTDTTLPRVVIERLAVHGGSVTFDDRQAGYSNALAPIDFELDDFSTLRDQGDTHTFSATSKQGGTVRWKGQAMVNPLRASGEIAIEDASLPALSVYLKSRAHAAIASGKFSATVPYEIAYADGRLDARLAGMRVGLKGLALLDESASPPLKVELADARFEASAQASQDANGFAAKVSGAALQVADVALSRGAPPVKIGKLGFEGGELDWRDRRLAVAKAFAEGADLAIVRDRKGEVNLLALFAPPTAKTAEAAAPAPAKAWSVEAASVEARRINADVLDEATGVRVHIADAAARIDGVSMDLARPLKFDASLAVREGGQLSAQGSVVPKSSSVQADVKVSKLDLRPLQPLLAQYLKLRIASGTFSAKGKVVAGAGSGTREKPALRYDGDFSVASLALRELDNDTFGSWRDVGAAKLTLALKPNRLDIPELRIVGADTKLVIEDDRSFNAARLLVNAPAANATAPAAPQAAPVTDDEPFPVRVRRVRVQDCKLDFTDLSLRPQFAAKIHELNGVINGLSSFRTARSQVELDGRVDEFGQARIRGELNPFVPRDNTDVSFIFRNVDMVPASPYSMKFAGYRIAEGKISLDLQYKVRNGQLEGDNKIVIDRLTLGEKVESPDAIKLPLQLAIAILKDTDGRIDLGIPVSGDLNDPQFSYSAVVWKAIANVITKIVTAPFRALGAMLGVGGEKLEAITFDAGSAKLAPPEKEKLQQVAQILAKRESLKLTVPGQYSTEADGAALRTLLVRTEVSQRAGIKLQPGEQPGPLDIADRHVRTAMRELYAQRFGDGELDKAKKAAEAAAPASAASAASASARTSGQALPIWQRVGKFIDGEPQVADPSAFYAALRTRLEREQLLPADSLPQLGAERANAVAALLVEAGVDPARVAPEKPEAVEAPAGRAVPLKLGLSAR